MILRQMSIALRRQDWSTIAIELVILIIGVFLGIQVSNWNEARVSENKSQEYMIRLLDDLKTDIDVIDQRLVYWQRVSDEGRKVVEFAEAGASTDEPWLLILALYNASQINGYRAKSTTFDELVSSGELAFIRDSALRADLANYYGSSSGLDAAVYSITPRYRELIRKRMPLVIQDYYWQECYALEREADTDFVTCSSPVAKDLQFELLSTFIQQDELINELRFWISNLNVSTSLATAEKEVAKTLAKRVGTLIPSA